MGNCNFRKPDEQDNASKQYVSSFCLNHILQLTNANSYIWFFTWAAAISISNFDLRFVIGRGGFGKVT